jgi:hypothetical protein
MSDQQHNEENLRREFESLGHNLVEAMRAAWETPESKRLRDEVVTGLTDLGVTLKKEADNLASSQAAQQVKNGVGQVGEKLRAGEVQGKVRNELLSALQTVNNELQKVIMRWSTDPANPSSTASAGQAAEAAPTGTAQAHAESVTLAPDEEHETTPGLIDADPYKAVPPGGGTGSTDDPAA